MSTFFSGTDTATLKEEGRDRNNFVSLIVNNEGTYTAAITRRLKTKQVKESISYEFFGDGEKHDTKEYTSNIDEIEWFYLKIDKEGDNYTFSNIESRLEEIKKAKAEKVKNLSQQLPINTNNNSNNLYNLDTVQPTLFKDTGDLPFKENYDLPYSQASFNKSTIKTLVVQLLTGSVIVSNTKIDIYKWANTMSTLYEKRFGKGEDGMECFKVWAETYTEFLTWYATDNNLEKLGFDETDICAICAHDMIEELNKLPRNIYINGYIEALKKYLLI